MSATADTTTFVVCICNTGYEASLETRKLYIRLPDEGGAQHGLVRIVDESGEDYLYPADRFVEIDLPTDVRKALRNPVA